MTVFNNNNVKKLVIIGNGFDLRLKLESSFESFYINDQLPKVKNWYNNPNDAKSRSKVNYISLLIYYAFFIETGNPFFGNEIHALFQQKFGVKNMSDWKDVEGFVEKILTYPEIKKAEHLFATAINAPSMIDRSLFFDGDLLGYYFVSAISSRNYKDLNYYQFIYQELLLFENDFTNYLLTEVKNNNDFYSKYRPELLRRIIVPYNSEIKVLNFNYTSLGKKEFPEFNIHGKLVEHNIIIGIDFKDNRNLNILPFTKTYRKLLSSNDSIILDEQYNEIIIYGHSLGRQDYSYFQSIFDFVNLYNSKTIVKFIYSDYYLEKKYKEKELLEEKDKLKKKMANALFSLIEEYGNTLDNKDNGKNLLHKLILEGRINLQLENFNDVFDN